DVMETDVVDVMETDVVDVMETDVVGAMETVVKGDENAVPNGRMEMAEKARMSETDRQETIKKSPIVKGKDLADDRETEIVIVRTKMAKDAMVGKVPASIAMKGGIPNPTTAPLPLKRRPMRPLIKSRAALVSFWPVSSEANRLAKINPEGNAITWKFSGFAVVLP
ncbi:MAG: hypothetical protein OSB39_08830, partial [Opitutales bacterium]|nr:hypothetical protein [Opitutales bacterium]